MQRVIPVVALVGAALTSACFSERSGQLTDPDEGRCMIALASPAIGSVGVVLGMRNFQFRPEEIRIPLGTRVTWVNCETTVRDYHTTTSDTGEWDSPEMLEGDSYSRVFDQPGRFPYHCIPHESFMRGVIIVE